MQMAVVIAHVILLICGGVTSTLRVEINAPLHTVFPIHLSLTNSEPGVEAPRGPLVKSSLQLPKKIPTPHPTIKSDTHPTGMVQ